jgi:hypothetical protein
MLYLKTNYACKDQDYSKMLTASTATSPHLQ